jgi:phosphonate transport system substrate-binding protein
MILLGCSAQEENYEPQYVTKPSHQLTYSFAVHPLHNPLLLQKTYGPLIDHLNGTVRGAKFKLIGSRDYATFNERLSGGRFQFALPNPYQAVMAIRAGYRIFGKVSDDDAFRGIIITRTNSPIKEVGDLRGKTISYPAPTAVAASMLPQYFLHSHGVSIGSTRTVYVGSMESAIESVASGKSDAAAIWPDPWNKYNRKNPGTARLLAVRWTTPPLINNALVVHESVPPEVSKHVLESLRQLSNTPAGRQLLIELSVAGFEAATNETYKPARTFFRKFSREVRPLPGFEGNAS